ncbi:MAG TPA: aminotransferase class III-fold pyridoxal phosphate-dependent enzyme [Polyangiaceae bacterium]|nr:aminotransferase class III-fold pyridoxal phosphate-dependent enzyme [Polyangiaceae bacterium]
MTDSLSSIRAIRERLLVTRAEGDLVFDAEDRPYIDLFGGNGAAFLGHVNPVVRDAVRAQLDRIWIAGALPTPSRLEAASILETFFPASYRCAGLYSTGMEAAEFAMRVARVVTGRRGLLGFDGGMHGKSTAAAALGWPSELTLLPDVRRLPYVAHASEERILELAGESLATGSVAAVFIEPLQGSAGGHLASNDFFRRLSALCERHGTLLVVDEIFSGFHRTGEAFLHQELGFLPDAVLVGKAMGNGFPVSAVMVHRKHPVDDRMLPNSTFSGNPLAAAAVVATLGEMRRTDVRSKVAVIERIFSEELRELVQAGMPLRGRGAFWVIELAEHAVDRTISGIFQGGVMVSSTNRYVRLLPAATIRPERLTQACRVIRDVCLRSR